MFTCICSIGSSVHRATEAKRSYKSNCGCHSVNLFNEICYCCVLLVRKYFSCWRSSKAASSLDRNTDKEAVQLIG